MFKILLKNSFSNVSARIIKLVITFIMSPMIVRALGNYDYGIWEIIISVVGYMGLLDIGMTSALVRYTSRYSALKDRNQLDNIYSSSLFFMVLISIIGFIFFILWATLAVDLLAKDISEISRYSIFLTLIGVQMLVIFPGYVFQSFHEGFQRYQFTNIVTIILSVIGSIILYQLLDKGGGLLSLTVINVSGISLRYLIYWIILRFPKYGGYVFSFKNICWNSTKELLIFGVKSFVIGVSLQISMGTAAIVIGTFLGPAIVTFYIISANFVRTICNLVSSTTISFMPYFSHLNAKKENDTTSIVFLVSSRYLIGTIFPLFAGLLFLGSPFISRWMGADYADKGEIVLYILTIAYLLPYLNPFSNRLLTGIGKQKTLAKLRFLSSLLTIILSVFLVSVLNKEGVALAALISAVIFEPMIFYYTCNQLNIKIWVYIRSVLLPLTLSAVIICGCLLFLKLILKHDSYPGILLIAITSSITYCLSFIFTAMKRDERIFLTNRIANRFEWLKISTN
jgi:O-antigen/teichoic acid export membrane protein